MCCPVALHDLHGAVPHLSPRRVGGALAQRSDDVSRRVAAHGVRDTEVERSTLTAAALHRTDDIVDRAPVGSDRRVVLVDGVGLADVEAGLQPGSRPRDVAPFAVGGIGAEDERAVGGAALRECAVTA